MHGCEHKSDQMDEQPQQWQFPLQLCEEGDDVGTPMMNALPFTEDDFDFKCADRVVHVLVHG